jgi:hypothetical protein
MTKPLTAEQQALAERFRPLALTIARQQAREHPDRDEAEIESAAMLGLTLAARGFDPAKMHDPRAWVQYRVKMTITDYVYRKGDWGDTRKLKGMKMPSVGPIEDGFEPSADCIGMEKDFGKPNLIGKPMTFTLPQAARRVGSDAATLMRLLTGAEIDDVRVEVVDGARRWIILDAALPVIREMVRAARLREAARLRARAEMLVAAACSTGE